MIERSTYTMLEWLGDIGGLFEALVFLGRMTIAPVAAIAMQAKLLTKAFWYLDPQGISGRGARQMIEKKNSSVDAHEEKTQPMVDFMRADLSRI